MHQFQLDITGKNNELWADIPEFEGYYQISNLGRIKSLGRTIYTKNNTRKIKERYRKLFDNGNGYLSCCLNNNGRMFTKLVHNLVATLFCENKNVAINTIINHIDGNKHNNNYSNLEWVTPAYSTRHAMNNGLFKNKGEDHAMAILTNEQVIEIRKIWGSTNRPLQRVIAEMYGVTQQTISTIVTKKHWN